MREISSSSIICKREKKRKKDQHARRKREREKKKDECVRRENQRDTTY